MAQTIRLVAYRNGVSYPLDLLSFPNISLNFNFTDIKDPASKQSSYSQTFKLPFTDNNNAYFQDWNNANTIYIENGFSTITENNASLFVNDVKQFTGFLQLKGSFNKSKHYDVILLSSVANLFSALGQKTLSSAFAGYTDLNHVFNTSTIQASWNNTMGANFDDTVADCSKIVYPITSASAPMIWQENDYLNNSTLTEEFEYELEDGSIDSFLMAPTNSLKLTEQKPAIQIRTLLERMFITNGYTWTSNFFDSVYFRKLYMTTCNHLEGQGSSPSIVSTEVGSTPSWGQFGYTDMRAMFFNQSAYLSNPLAGTPMLRAIETSTQTYQNLTWNDGSLSLEPPQQAEGNMATIVDGMYIEVQTTCTTNQLQVNINTNVSVVCEQISGDLVTPLDDDSTTATLGVNNWRSNVGVIYQIVGEDGLVYGQSSPTKIVGASQVNGVNTLANQSSFGGFDSVRNNINFSDGSSYPDGDFQPSIPFVTNTNYAIPSGTKVTIMAHVVAVNPATNDVINIGTGGFEAVAGNIVVLLGKPSQYVGQVNDVDCVTTITINGAPSQYDNTMLQDINIQNCIDPSLSQKGLLKDLTDRFNLVIKTNEEDSSNLIIEPMNDFLSTNSSIKLWTDKLDTSKEIINEPTTSMRFKEIHLSDLPDVDFMNKFVNDFNSSNSPHGRFDMIYNSSNYNSGKTLKNESIFSPYIVEETPISLTSSDVDLSAERILVHRGYSYDDDGNLTFPATKPKLFYYGGRPVELPVPNNSDYNIYFHFGIASLVGVNEYPLCSAFNIDRSLTEPSGTTGMNANTKALRWGQSFNFGSGNIPFGYSSSLSNTFFNLYWANYISQLYNTSSRIMIAYFMLDEIDISQFEFNDSIFVKDAFWRVISIQNYQAGIGASVKVKLVKIIDAVSQLNDDVGCNYYPSGGYYGNTDTVIWIDANDNITETFLVPAECCIAFGYSYTEFGGNAICNNPIIDGTNSDGNTSGFVEG